MSTLAFSFDRLPVSVAKRSPYRMFYRNLPRIDASEMRVAPFSGFRIPKPQRLSNPAHGIVPALKRPVRSFHAVSQSKNLGVTWGYAKSCIRRVRGKNSLG